MAHDWQYHQKTLAKKTLDWSVPNTRLYEAFTGWARSIPPCPHCLAKDHGGVNCLHNSNPPILGWFQGSSPIQVTLYSQLQTTPAKPAAILEVCRSFNTNRCWFSRCQYSHVCSDCEGPRRALNCLLKQSMSTGRVPLS